MKRADEADLFDFANRGRVPERCGVGPESVRGGCWEGLVDYVKGLCEDCAAWIIVCALKSRKAMECLDIMLEN